MEFNLSRREKERLRSKNYYYNNKNRLQDYQRIYQMNKYYDNKENKLKTNNIKKDKQKDKNYQNQTILNKLKFENLHIPIVVRHYFITLYFD